MQVFVNNKITNVPQGQSLLSLLDQMGLKEQQGIAIAVNETVIPKVEWHHTELKENDNIILIKATAGG